MFDYSDPSGTDLLTQFRAISEWRAFAESWYQRGAMRSNSAFTYFDVLASLPDSEVFPATIDWKAFPILSQHQSDEDIDSDRFNLQEEYVEWLVVRDTNGEIDEIIFTTEFREYFAVLAAVSPTGIAEAVRQLTPGADPTTSELYGVSSVNGRSPRERFNLFLNHVRTNPWNNGEKGIMALTMPINSYGALFGLSIDCGVANTSIPPDHVCANVGGACVPGRQSDPRICTVCQEQAQGNKVFSLDDPAGVFISNLTGIWTVGDVQVPINDPNQNQGRWLVTRNGRRARLKVGGANKLRLDNDEIVSGAQVAKKLFVAANVVTAFNSALPEWAKTGNEFITRPDERIA